MLLWLCVYIFFSQSFLHFANVAETVVNVVEAVVNVVSSVPIGCIVRCVVGLFAKLGVRGSSLGPQLYILAMYRRTIVVPFDPHAPNLCILECLWHPELISEGRFQLPWG